MPTTPAAAPIELHCPACGYDLRGIGQSPRCPECGRPRAHPAEGSHIPWEHRRQIGRVRAYVRTAWLASVRPTHIARDAVDRQVDLAAARSFRRVTVVIAFIPL